MRILRRQSNLEVSSKGLAYFVVGIVLSTFLGGAVRVTLRSDRVQQRVLQELQTLLPKIELHVGHAQLLLSRGILPGLALRMQDIRMQQKACGKLQFNLSVNESVLPVELLSLIRGRIRIGDAEVSSGNLHLDFQKCAVDVVASEGAAPQAADQPEPVHPPSIEKLILPRVDWQKVAAVVSGFEVKNFSVTYEAQPTWKLWVRTAELDFANELDATARVEVQKSLPFGEVSHRINLSIQTEGELLLADLKTEFKEGRLQAQAQANLQSQAARVTLDIRQVPLKDFMQELSRLELVDRDLQLKSTWLSCDLQWDGEMSQVSAAPLKISACRIEGGYGRAELERAELWLDKGPYFRTPALLQVKQLQLQPVFEAIDVQVLPAIFSQVGQWSGTFAFISPQDWSMMGYLENAEVLFAHQSSRGKQTLTRVRTNIRQRLGTSAVQLDEFDLKQGVLKGKIEGELSETWTSGRFQLKLEQFALAPSIQKLLMGGSLASITGEGFGVLREGEVQSWTGVFALPRAEGQGWTVEGIRVQSKFYQGTFYIDSKAESAQVAGSWIHFPEFQKLLNNPAEEMRYRDLNTRVEIRKTGGSVERASARSLAIGGKAWQLKGTWIRDGVFRGQIGVPTVGGRSKSYQLVGDRGRLHIADEN